jgi:hypothetical protein
MSIGGLLAAALKKAFGGGFEKEQTQLANAVQSAILPTLANLHSRLSAVEAATGVTNIPLLPPDTFTPPTEPSGSASGSLPTVRGFSPTGSIGGGGIVGGTHIGP